MPTVAEKLQLLKEKKSHINVMHAMGPNVAGMIGTAIAAGILLAILG